MQINCSVERTGGRGTREREAKNRLRKREKEGEAEEREGWIEDDDPPPFDPCRDYYLLPSVDCI